MKSTSVMIRQDKDKYFTPPELVSDFLAVEKMRSVFDPAAGAGHMLTGARRRGIPGRGIDIAPDAAEIRQADFLGPVREVIGPGESIICNPPFGPQGRSAVAFIERALEIASETRGSVAMLLHEDFDAGITRRRLFADNVAFARKYVLLNRIYWVNLAVAERSSTNHAFFVWHTDRREEWATEPVVRYLASSSGQDWGKQR